MINDCWFVFCLCLMWWPFFDEIKDKGEVGSINYRYRFLIYPLQHKYTTHSATRKWWLELGSRWWQGFGAGRCGAGRYWPGIRRFQSPRAWGAWHPAHSRRWCRRPCWWRRAASGRRPTAAWRSRRGLSQHTTTGSPVWGYQPRHSTAQRCLPWALSQTWVTSQTQLERKRVSKRWRWGREGERKEETQKKSKIEGGKGSRDGKGQEVQG